MVNSDYGDWWTAPTEANESGRLVMVTGRRDIESFKSNPKFNIRVEVSWPYEADKSGMPDGPTSELMEKATDSLKEVLRKDPVAVMTGIYTGDGRRDWVFYTLSTRIFQNKLNQALADLPLLPLEVSAENDPEWEEYAEMRAISEIAPEE